MNIISKIKNKIIKEINQFYKHDLVDISDLVYPPDSNMGDLSLPCFKLAKALGKNSSDVAGEIMQLFNESEKIESVKTSGPYLNFTLNKINLAKYLFAQIEKEGDEFGKTEVKKPKRIMVEFSNGNTHKEIHAGHLRNIAYGDAVVKILKASGEDVIPVSYINDFGIHVAKTLWAYLEFYKDAELPENKGRFLGEVYVRATNELKDNEVGKRLVGMLMKKIESRQGEEYELWKKTREWTIAQFDKIYQELGIKFDEIFYESDVIDEGVKLVDELKEKNILQASQGAIIADLEEYNLGVLPVVRSDGTALYPVADLALAKLKFDKFKLDESIYVVDVRQALNFKQLFKLLELWGYKQKMIHLGYEFLKLPSGMMSSRTGNVITYDDVKEQALAKAVATTSEKHSEWTKEKINEVAWKIVKGAIKFEMLKVSQSQIITFDIEQALKFEGYTAAYLQYTYARIQSIINKADIAKRITHNAQHLKEDKEKILILSLAKFPGIISKAASGYDPSEIAKYLNELARNFNDYYHSVPILKSEEDVMSARLTLIKSVSQIIKNGLALLGIEVMEEM